MAQLKKFSDYQGIDSRSNDIVRQEGYLRDALNVTVDDNVASGLAYRKRPGFRQEHNLSGNDGLINYREQDELIILAATPRIFDGNVTTVMKTAETNPLGTGVTGQIADWAEINDVLYIAKGGTDLLKYDGQRIYKAGLPKAHVNAAVIFAGGTLPGGPDYGYQYTYEFEFTDKKGNVVISDSGTTDLIGGPGVGTTNNGKHQAIIYPVYQNQEGFAATLTPDIDGFNSGFAEITARYPVGSGTFDTASSITIPVLAGHTFETGDQCYLRHSIAGFATGTAEDIAAGLSIGEPRDLLWESFEITGTTTTSITVSNPRNLGVFAELRVGTFEGATYISSINMNVYRADNSGAGAIKQAFYFESLGVIIDSTLSVKYEDTGSTTLVTADPYISPELINIPPYQSKYIEYHKGLLFQSGATVRITKTDGSYITEDKPHTVFYGSTDGFASIENFVLGGNNLLVGDDSEGVITALHSHNDFLIIFKERGIHYVSGNVITGAFRVDKVHGSQIGCLSHGSIQEVNGAVFFLSERGVYYTFGGGSPVAVSEPITPLFLDDNLDKTACTSTFVFRDQKYYLFIPFTGGGGRMFVYDYHYESWLVWDVPAEGGLALYQDKLYAATGGELIVEQETRTDDWLGGAAINAYLFTNFEHLGEPSIYKKFINIKAFSLRGTTYELTIESFKDWVDNVTKTDNTIDFTATRRFDKVKALAGDNKAHSFAVKFSNNNVGEDMVLTGWELEYEAPYGKLKE